MRSGQRRRELRLNSPRACCLFLACLPVLFAVAVVIRYLHGNRPVQLAIPTPAMPSPNALDDFVRAGRLARGLRHPSPYSMPLPPTQAATPANFTACAKGAGPVFAAIRSGLGKEFRARPVRSYYAGLGITQHASYREIARTVAGAAEGYWLMGRPGAAADALLDGEEMSVMAPRGESLIGDLTGLACEEMCLRPLEPLLPRLSAAELTHVGERLDRIAAKRTPYADIVMEEAWENTASMAELLRNEHTPRRLWETAWSLAPDRGAGLAAIRRARSAAGFVMSNKTAMLRENLAYYRAVAEECRRPYAPKSRVPVPGNFIAQMGIDIVVQARPSHVFREAIVEVLRAEVALLRYRAGHGRSPESLTSLVPAYLKSVPGDPFGGKAGVPLQYRVLRNGDVLLYSVGTDMRDDGGVPAAYPLQTPGDIVAGQLFPRRAHR